MNLIILIFSLLSTTIIIFGSIINLYEGRIPAFFVKTFRYGKFAYQGQVSKVASKAIIEVPKSWFKHFYWIGVVSYTYLLYLATVVYFLQQDVPEWFLNCLNILCGEYHTASTCATDTYIAIVLMTLQVYRRFYDTHFVSVFGKDVTMNLSQYVVGLIHYPGTALALICEAPNFARKNLLVSSELNIDTISYRHMLAVTLFLWAWWHQFVTSKILADLRKNRKGKIVSNEHKLPEGDWFKYLSAPHQTAEILMYFSMMLLLPYNKTWFFVFAWVLCNQVETILLSHWWYQETFSNFPKTRRALIPFLY